MKQAMLYDVEDIRIMEVPIPAPGPGEVLVRNKISTTCGTDVKNFKRGYPLLKPPHPYGHEFSGVVAAVGRRGDTCEGGGPGGVPQYRPLQPLLLLQARPALHVREPDLLPGELCRICEGTRPVAAQNMFVIPDTLPQDRLPHGALLLRGLRY